MTGSQRRAGITDPRLLLLLPEAVYLASYADLALYHGRTWLWSTLVHESGRYLFPQTGFPDELGQGSAAGTSVNLPFAIIRMYSGTFVCAGHAY